MNRASRRHVSTRFRHLRLVRPWSFVVRQYLGQSEILQLRWGLDQVSQLLGCSGDCLGLATWACPAAKETLKPYTVVLLVAELAGTYFRPENMQGQQIR